MISVPVPPSIMAIRSRLREPKDVTGSDQPSQAESGDQLNPSMLPSPMLLSRDIVPARVSARKMSPKDVPTASQRPSGLASMALARLGLGKSIRVRSLGAGVAWTALPVPAASVPAVSV